MRQKTGIGFVRWLGCGALAMLLVACAEGQDAERSADPIAEPAANSENTSSTADAPGLGQWRTIEAGDGPGLAYSGEAIPEIVFRCDERDGIVVERRGILASPTTDMMRLTTAGGTSLFAVRPVQSEGMLRAIIPPSDEMIARLLRGESIMLAFDPAEEITLPATPMVPELIAQCRRSETRAPTD